MTKTICILSSCQFNEFSGGIDRVCCILTREFIRRGHRMVFVYGQPNSSGGIADGCVGSEYCFPFGNIWDARNEAFFVDVLKKEQIEVVIDVSYQYRFHDIAYAAKNQTDFILISTCHVDPVVDIKELRDKFDKIAITRSGISKLAVQVFHILKYPLSYFLRRKSMVKKHKKKVEESDYYVLLCEDYANQVKKMVGESLAGKIRAICNPFPDGHNDSGNITGKMNQILFVGRMDWQKRVDRLLRIWSKVESHFPDWELVLVGGGGEENLFRSYARRLGLSRTRFIGAVKSGDYIRESKILALCSSHEGFTMVLVEALHERTIPVLFDSFKASHEMVIDGQNGLLIKSFDEDLFARKLANLMEDETYLASLRNHSGMTLSRFEVSRIAREWEALF